MFTVCATCNVISPMKYVLYFYSSTFQSMYTVPIMSVLCSSLISCFPGMLFRYCLSDFEIVPVVPIVPYYLSLLLSHSTCGEFLLWGRRRRRLFSQTFSSWYFSWTNNDPHRSGFKFQTAVLSALCVMFLV